MASRLPPDQGPPLESTRYTPWDGPVRGKERETEHRDGPPSYRTCGRCDNPLRGWEGENGPKCVGPRAQSTPHLCYPPDLLCKRSLEGDNHAATRCGSAFVRPVFALCGGGPGFRSPHPRLFGPDGRG